MHILVHIYLNEADLEMAMEDNGVEVKTFDPIQRVIEGFKGVMINAEPGGIHIMECNKVADNFKLGEEK